MKWLMRRCVATVAGVMLCAPGAWSAETRPLDPALGRVEDRKELRELLGQMEKAIDSLDIDGVLKLMTKEAVVTWQNAEVSRGHDQIRAYHARMVRGAAPIVTKFSTKATLGGPAVFYGDTAIAYGTTVDTYELAEGLKFVLDANWSTTVVKQDGQWKAAAIHFSTHLFDNALVRNARRLAWIAGAGAFAAGLLVAFVLVRLRRRK